jgi:hypothetical protein
MDYHNRLDDFQKEYGLLDRESFLLIFRHPFLVFHTGEPGVFPSQVDLTAEARTDFPQGELPDLEACDFSRIFVAALKPSPRGENPSGLILGRDAGCDVVIPHPAVSRRHAYFRRHAGTGEPRLCDLGSRTGTVVDGDRLGADEGVPLESGSQIVIAGAVPALYLTPYDFYLYLHRKCEQHCTRLRECAAVGPGVRRAVDVTV